ncbi:MAG: GIY-YIG nuclease family protein [Bacteroidales bacterium]
MFTTYILYSEKASQYYIGQTGNFENRFREHLRSKCKSTCFADDWTCVFRTDFATRNEAVAMETKIKKRGVTRFLQDLNGSAVG